MQRKLSILATAASFVACQPNCDDREITGPDEEPVGTSTDGDGDGDDGDNDDDNDNDDDGGGDDDHDDDTEYCDVSEFELLQPQWLDRRQARLPGAREDVRAIGVSEDALFVIDHPVRDLESDLNGYLERRTLAGDLVWEVEFHGSVLLMTLALDDEHVYVLTTERAQRWTLDGEPDEWSVEATEDLRDMSVSDTVALLDNQSRDTVDVAEVREVSKDLPLQEVESLLIEPVSEGSVYGGVIEPSPWGGWVVGTLEFPDNGPSQVRLVTTAADVDVDVRLAFEAGVFPSIRAIAADDGELVVASSSAVDPKLWVSRITNEAGGRELSRAELSPCDRGAGYVGDIVAHDGSFWVFGGVEVAPSPEHDNYIRVLLNVDYAGEVLGRYRVDLEGGGWRLRTFAKTDQGLYIGGHQRRADGEFDRVLGRLEP